MFSKIKMSCWDFFVHLQSGVTVTILVFITLVAMNKVSISLIKDIPIILSGFFFIMFLWLIGMLMEPFANYMDKIASFKMKTIIKNFSLTGWDADIEQLTEVAISYMPKLQKNIFQYAKNCIIANNKADDYNIFLSRFGFYRNHACIFMFYAVIAFFIFSAPYSLIITSISLILCAAYLYRSCVFYRHISVTVYSQFIAHMSSLQESK